MVVVVVAVTASTKTTLWFTVLEVLCNYTTDLLQCSKA